MIKSSKFFTLALTISLLGLSSGNIQKNSHLALKAATPMPTMIDTSHASLNELQTYYKGVEGKKGDTLLAQLYENIKDHNEYDYDSSTHRTIYKIIDRQWELSPLSPEELQNFNYETDNPYIRKFYADYNDDPLTADLFRNPGASRVSFDKEHIWAQSLGDFGRTGGTGSDFHSLLPADVRGNQQAHSNYNFATPTSGVTSYTNDKGSYVGQNGYIAGSSQKVFEPTDEYKGDVARAMFYMTARYYEYIDVLHPKLTLVDGSPSALVASPTQPGLAGDLETLLAWHTLDPVDEYEIHRNNLIYNNYQENRNPFIDFPEWADIIFDANYVGDGASFDGGDPVEPEEPSITLTRIEIDINPQANFFFLEQVNKSDFIVTAHYSDDTSKVVTNYTLTSGGNPLTTYNQVGEIELTFSFSEESVTATKSITITVNLTTLHYVVIGGAALILIGLGILLPKLRKKVIKKGKIIIKKTRKKHIK